jgi:MFS family permease
MQGARGPILVGLVAQIYKGGSVGAIFGTLSLALGTGAAAGSWASGALHAWTGGYRWSFVMAIVAVGVGMCAFGLSRSLREGRI